jgi:hypothetical protein
LENFAGWVEVWVEPLADVELAVFGGSGAPGREGLVGGGYGPSVWDWDDFAGACWSAVVIEAAFFVVPVVGNALIGHEKKDPRQYEPTDTG